MAEIAHPRYSLGQTVGYYDRQGRWQMGEVNHIEANWYSWGRSIIYTVGHPSYAGRRMYIGEDKIGCVITARSRP